MPQKITPFLWFDQEAEQAATLYVSVFPGSRITGVTRYGEAGPGPVGSAMVVTFELQGQPFIALNGGPHFKFTEAVSFSVNCESQEEVDHYWDKLSEGGEPGRCGWLKDRFGLSWQVVPSALGRLLGDPDPAKAKRAMAAMMGMGKLEIQVLQDASDGKS